MLPHQKINDLQSIGVLVFGPEELLTEATVGHNKNLTHHHHHLLRLVQLPTALWFQDGQLIGFDWSTE